MFYAKANSRNEAVALFEVSDTGYYGTYLDKDTFEWVFREGLGSDVAWDTDTFRIPVATKDAIIESFKTGTPYVLTLV